MAEQHYVAHIEQVSSGLQWDGPQELGSVRWDGFTHRHMWNMIMDAQPADVFQRYDRWTRLGEEFLGVNENVQNRLNTLFASWQGTAAMSAGMSNTRLLQWSQEAAETTQRIGEGLGTYGNALVQARKTMPQPRAMENEQDFRAGDGTTGWTGPENAYLWLQLQSDHLATAKERAEAREGAIAVMQAFESDAVNVDREVSSLPRYDTMPPAVDVQHMDTPGTPPPGPGDDGVVLPPHGDPVGTGPAGTGPAGAGPGGTGPGSGPGGPGGVGPGGTGPGGYGSNPGQGGPNGYGPYGPGRPGGVGPGGAGGPGGRYGVGGGPGGAGGAGASEAAARGGAAGRGATFGAVPGGAAAAEAAAARGAGGGAAGRGVGGGMYPPMGGMGGRGDDDTEKRVAPYLVDGDDLFDDDRTVAPPVFGA